MTSAEALRLAIAAARVGRLEYTRQARQRMRERGARDADVERACVTATSSRLEPNEVWRLDGGADCDGDALTVCVAIAHNVVVVTLF